MGVLMDEGKMPSQNIEAVRAIVTSMGNHFSYDDMKSTSIAAGEICNYVINVIKYYDGLGAGSQPKGKVVVMGKCVTGLERVTNSTMSIVRMGTAPPSVQTSFVAVMHMLAGLNINEKVVVDANGKLK